MDKLFELASVLINILIRSKLGGDRCDNYVDIVTTLKDLGLEIFEAREVRRGFEKIGDNLVSSCEKILENSTIEQERKEIIIKYVQKAYQSLNLSYETIYEMINNDDRLKHELLNVDLEYKKQLDPSEIEIYMRLIDYTVYFIINASISLPEFNQNGIKRLVGLMDDLVDKIDEVIRQIEKVNELVDDKDIKTRNFERNYRYSILNKYKYINLFGAGFEREYKRYQLEIAYVQLEIFDDRMEKNVDVNQLFTLCRNVWLSGDAGLGKTTFLQWIAVCSAGNVQEIDGIRDTIPILIELRKTLGIQQGLKDYELSES